MYLREEKDHFKNCYRKKKKINSLLSNITDVFGFFPALWAIFRKAFCLQCQHADSALSSCKAFI